MAEDIDIQMVLQELLEKISLRLKIEQGKKEKQILFLLYADIKNFSARIKKAYTVGDLQKLEEKYFAKFEEYVAQLHASVQSAA